VLPVVSGFASSAAEETAAADDADDADDAEDALVGLLADGAPGAAPAEAAREPFATLVVEVPAPAPVPVPVPAPFGSLSDGDERRTYAKPSARMPTATNGKNHRLAAGSAARGGERLADARAGSLAEAGGGALVPRLDAGVIVVVAEARALGGAVLALAAARWLLLSARADVGAPSTSMVGGGGAGRSRRAGGGNVRSVPPFGAGGGGGNAGGGGGSLGSFEAAGACDTAGAFDARAGAGDAAGAFDAAGAGGRMLAAAGNGGGMLTRTGGMRAVISSDAGMMSASGRSSIVSTPRDGGCDRA
jgi:hypothetical protein